MTQPVKPINPLPTPHDLAMQAALAKMLREGSMRRSDTGPGTYGPVQPRQNPNED